MHSLYDNTPGTVGGPGGKKDRLNDGNNNGQAMHGARKHAWRTQAAWANNNIGFQCPVVNCQNT